MKKWLCLFAICLGLVVIWVSPAACQSDAQGYTFVSGVRGPLVCRGQWIPSESVTTPGTCEGQLYGISQLTALSASQSADRLAEILVSLDSIDQRLAVSNEQLKRLVDTTVATQNSMSEQARSVSEVLHEIISRRFDELPAEMLASKEFRKEIKRLKEEILGDVEKLYPKQPAPPAK